MNKSEADYEARVDHSIKEICCASASTKSEKMKYFRVLIVAIKLILLLVYFLPIMNSARNEWKYQGFAITKIESVTKEEKWASDDFSVAYKVQYSYTINSVKYVSTKIQDPEVEYHTSRWVDENIKKGDTTSIRFNKSNPAESILTTRVGSETFMLAQMALILMIFLYSGELLFDGRLLRRKEFVKLLLGSAFASLIVPGILWSFLVLEDPEAFSTIILLYLIFPTLCLASFVWKNSQSRLAIFEK